MKPFAALLAVALLVLALVAIVYLIRLAWRRTAGRYKTENKALKQEVKDLDKMLDHMEEKLVLSPYSYDPAIQSVLSYIYQRQDDREEKRRKKELGS